MGGPKFPIFEGKLKEMKDWIASIEKRRRIYEMLDKERLSVTFTASLGTLSDFIGDRMVGDPQLT